MNGVDISVFAFLTTWTYIVLTVYLLLHFLLCVIYACEVDGSVWKRLTNENHRRMFHELQVQPSLWANEDYDYIPGNGDNQELGNVTDVQFAVPQQSPSILAKLVWVFYNVASLGCFLVTIIFWTMLYPHLPHMDSKNILINFQLHAVTSIIIIIEHCLSAIPVRLYHVVYGLSYGIIYVAFSGILYAVNHAYVLYPNVLDWSKPSATVIVICITAFVALPVLQLILYLLYCVKLKIFNVCNPEEL